MVYRWCFGLFVKRLVLEGNSTIHPFPTMSLSSVHRKKELTTPEMLVVHPLTVPSEPMVREKLTHQGERKGGTKGGPDGPGSGGVCDARSGGTGYCRMVDRNTRPFLVRDSLDREVPLLKSPSNTGSRKSCLRVE